MVDTKWRWCLLIFCASFLISWIFFATIYYFVLLFRGDFNHLNDDTWTPCVQNAKSWVSLFMFSLESQHTIGYGYRYPNEHCPEVIVLICIQSMLGVVIQTLMTGVVFAKLARPKKRAATLLFSNNAIICMRDGQLCFLFRVGDMRKSQLAEAHIRLQMIKRRFTAEGEMLAFHQFDMNVGFDSGLDRIFVVWPIAICHVIDQDSPLYDVSAEDLRTTAQFEIVAILEGVVDSTGSTTQARTSYLPSEILWSHRFEKLLTYRNEAGDYRINFSRFHNTYPIQMPPFSAKQLHEMRDAGLQPEKVYQYDVPDESNPQETVEDVDLGVRPPLQSISETVSNYYINPDNQVSFEDEVFSKKSVSRKLTTASLRDEELKPPEDSGRRKSALPAGQNGLAEEIVGSRFTVSRPYVPELEADELNLGSLSSLQPVSPVINVSKTVRRNSILREHDIM